MGAFQQLLEINSDARGESLEGDHPCVEPGLFRSCWRARSGVEIFLEVHPGDELVSDKNFDPVVRKVPLVGWAEIKLACKSGTDVFEMGIA